MVARLAAAADQRPLERTLEIGGSRIEVTVRGAPGQESAFWRWIDDSARAVSGHFGSFPVPRVRLAVRIVRGARIGSGVTMGGAVPSIDVAVGSDATPATFRRDWVLTHEMAHLGFPDLTSDDTWAEEGMATYIEPIARVRIGTLEAGEPWHQLVEGVPEGLPKAGDQGLHGTRSWGRTYWGGALFWLLADLEIREATGGRRGLEHALRGVLSAGGSIRRKWSLERALRVADGAAGVSVLVPLYREMAFQPVRTDLDAQWRRLGVRWSGRGVVFEDDANLSPLRRAITPDAPRRAARARDGGDIGAAGRRDLPREPCIGGRKPLVTTGRAGSP